eukprot:2600563-Pleurochrysis_carterae.AAC.1
MAGLWCFMTPFYNHARLAWRVPASLRICLKRPSGAGGKMTITTNTNSHWSGSGRSAGAGRTYGRFKEWGAQRAGRLSRAGFREPK